MKIINKCINCFYVFNPIKCESSNIVLLALSCFGSLITFGSSLYGRVKKNIEILQSIKNYLATRILAAAGNPIAQYKLGCMYLYGHHGVQKDAKKVTYWFELAAKKGNADAQFYFGAMPLLEGDEVEKSFEESFKWFNLAAMQGNANAQSFLDGRYIKNSEDGKNFENALKWLEFAAKKGNANAQFYLAVQL